MKRKNRMNIIAYVNREQLEGRQAIERLISHYRRMMSEPITCPFDAAKSWAWNESRWHGAGRFIKHEFKDVIKSLNPDDVYLISKESRGIYSPGRG